MREISDIQEMFLLISERSQNLFSSFSVDGVFTYISPNVQALLGYTQEEVIGKPAASFNHPDTNKKFLEHRNRLDIDQDTVLFTGRVRHKNGEYHWYETTAQYIRDESGEIIQTIAVGRDITERKEVEETITHLAYHDSLTNLPNRRMFEKHASLFLDEFRQELHVLMLLDLDGFKHVNDTFGHDIGDLLLIEVANRLTLAVGDKGFVARWGGDEFTVFQSRLGSKSALTLLLERMKDCISKPMIIEGHTIFITPSIGVAFSREDGDTIEALMKNADTAMYRAKNQERINSEDKSLF